MMDFALKLSKEYGKGYLSYSSIKYALEDMKKFEMKMRDELVFDSPALAFGKLYDCMLLTPEFFDTQFVVVDDTEICKEIGGKAPKRTKAYAEWLESLENDGRAVAMPEDVAKAQEMIDRLRLTGVDKIALQGNMQYEFNDFIDDVPVRGFLDVLGDGYITDSKTTANISKFKWAVRDFGYDIQAFMYSKVLGTTDFRWVVQDKSYPYAVGLFYASEDTLRYGEHKFRTAVDRIKTYLGEGKSTESDYQTGEI